MLLGTALEHQINLLNTHCQVPIILQVFSSGIALLEFLFKKMSKTFMMLIIINVWGQIFFLEDPSPDENQG